VNTVLKLRVLLKADDCALLSSLYSHRPVGAEETHAKPSSSTVHGR
jgi:hypothetical protein